MIHPSSVLKGRRQFQFERFGAAYHLKIADTRDLEAVLDLDEAHWVATTAPAATLNCDPVFLQLIDTDNDGRLRAEEIKDAIRFLFEQLPNKNGIVPGNTRLDLKAVNRHSEIGGRIYNSATKIRNRLALPEDAVTLAQVRTIEIEVLEGGLDKAGIVLPEAAQDKKVRQIIEDILATVGGKPHPRGGQGVDDAALEHFLQQCRQYQDWRSQAVPKDGSDVSEILPLGEATDKETGNALNNR